jgi:hypothetical protein
MYLGLAIHLATEIGLHRKILPEHLAGIVKPDEIDMELRNRERTWWAPQGHYLPHDI